jgi:hypothetical protein
LRTEGEAAIKNSEPEISRTNRVFPCSDILTFHLTSRARLPLGPYLRATRLKTGGHYESVVGVFKWRSDAKRGAAELVPLEIPKARINVLTAEVTDRVVVGLAAIRRMR